MFGLTRREWFMIGIGQAVHGALIGAVLHSLGLVVFNAACLAFDIYMLPKTGSEE